MDTTELSAWLRERFAQDDVRLEYECPQVWVIQHRPGLKRRLDYDRACMELLEKLRESGACLLHSGDTPHQLGLGSGWSQVDGAWLIPETLDSEILFRELHSCAWFMTPSLRGGVFTPVGHLDTALGVADTLRENMLSFLLFSFEDGEPWMLGLDSPV